PAAAWDACANPHAIGQSSRAHRAEAGPGSGSDDAPAPHPACQARTVPLRLDSISREEGFNPFISHDFLSRLEASGSVAARAGWQPQHLVAEHAEGDVVGVAPCYLKSHSRGEYVFDHGWAEAYERAGGSYYPKLQVSVPFTPATGRRLLVRSD